MVLLDRALAPQQGLQRHAIQRSLSDKRVERSTLQMATRMMNKLLKLDSLDASLLRSRVEMSGDIVDGVNWLEIENFLAVPGACISEDNHQFLS